MIILEENELKYDDLVSDFALDPLIKQARKYMELSPYNELNARILFDYENKFWVINKNESIYTIMDIFLSIDLNLSNSDLKEYLSERIERKYTRVNDLILNKNIPKNISDKIEDMFDCGIYFFNKSKLFGLFVNYLDYASNLDDFVLSKNYILITEYINSDYISLNDVINLLNTKNMKGISLRKANVYQYLCVSPASAKIKEAIKQESYSNYTSEQLSDCLAAAILTSDYETEVLVSLLM